MPIVVVERSYSEPMTHEKAQAMTEQGAWCYEVHRIKYLHSLISADGLRMLCVYDAPDLESVRKAQETTAAAYDRVWAASFFTVDDSRDPRKP